MNKAYTWLSSCVSCGGLDVHRFCFWSSKRLETERLLTKNNKMFQTRQVWSRIFIA
ncbi:unnamed protein product, partial [Cylicocyclus nassatus]